MRTVYFRFVDNQRPDLERMCVHYPEETVARPIAALAELKFRFNSQRRPRLANRAACAFRLCIVMEYDHANNEARRGSLAEFKPSATAFIY